VPLRKLSVLPPMKEELQEMASEKMNPSRREKKK
jgi:hypothetical protein